MVNFPAFFTSAVASCTKLSTTLATAFFFITFMAFTIAEKSVQEVQKCYCRELLGFL